MPIYEYRCERCGNISEYLVGNSNEEEVIECRHCGSREISRILSVSSFSLGSSDRVPGRTCCGREERCEVPPCGGGGGCRRD